jgi:UDP-2,4-diacetamido-2,4,6-trideoxy-beta-L-altropyranose hydrolase
LDFRLDAKKVLIRCDASSKIGTGHLMRDFVLAQRFSKSEVAFATRALLGNLDALIEAKGFTHHSLKNNKPKALIKLLKQNDYDLLVIDHYGIDAVFERKIKEALPELTLMVLDDTYQQHHCDILLNHNIYAKKKHYKNLVPKKTQLLCGAKYTLLREEFLTPQTPSEKDSILIAMGGSDPRNLTLKILKSLPKEFTLEINVITTNANKKLQKLEAYAKENKNITLHIQTKEVAKLALRAHFAIITPSGFANELYAIKTPFIAIQSAKNQEFMSAFLSKRGFGVLKAFSKKAFVSLFEAETRKALL